MLPLRTSSGKKQEKKGLNLPGRKFLGNAQISVKSSVRRSSVYLQKKEKARFLCYRLRDVLSWVGSGKTSVSFEGALTVSLLRSLIPAKSIDPLPSKRKDPHVLPTPFLTIEERKSSRGKTFFNRQSTPLYGVSGRQGERDRKKEFDVAESGFPSVGRSSGEKKGGIFSLEGKKGRGT